MVHLLRNILYTTTKGGQVGLTFLKLLGLQVILRCSPGNDLLQVDGELVRVKRAAFSHFLARFSNFVSRFHSFLVLLHLRCRQGARCGLDRRQGSDVIAGRGAQVLEPPCRG